jgi:uncharacterized delta-60 repeat protein
VSTLAQTTPIPGSLDTTFGNAGKVVSASMGTDDVVWKLAIQPDGKIVAGGHCKVNNRNEFCFARLNADGSFDTSFTGPTGTAAGKFSWAVVSGDSYAFGLALQSDGKIVAAGNCVGAGEDTCVVRLNANGSIDTTFGGLNGAAQGSVVSALSTGIDKAYEVAIQSDGKIVVGGSCEKDGSARTDFCVTRYSSSGVLDDTFGERVVAAQSPRTGTARVSISGKQDTLLSLALQTDGKIVAVGDCYDASDNSQVCAIRLSGNNGTLDSTFTGPSGGSGGKFALDVGAKGTGYVTRVQSDGKIVIAGGCYENLTTTEAFCFARLNANGSYDTTFNGPLGDGAGRFLLPIVPRNRIDDFANGLAIQADGKIVAGGQCDITVSAAAQTNACLARMNSDGSLDATFDGTLPTVGNGKFVVPMVNAENRFEAIAIQADGKIVAAGRCVNGTDGNFCLARFHGNSIPVSQCSLDIDGDGNPTATIDGLIATRVMLGLRDNAVVGNITFPLNATRTNWTDIREFLVTQCGMTITP